MSFKKTFYKNILNLGQYNYASQIAIFLSSIVLSRLLLPSEYGYFALIIVFTGFINLFTNAGLSFSIIRSDYGKTYHKAVGNLSFYIGLILFLLLAVFAYPIAIFYNDKSLIIPIIVISTTYIIGSFKIAPMGVLLKRLDFNYVGKARFFSNIGSIILMIILASLGFSYWALLIPQFLIHIIQYLMFENRVKLGFKLHKISYTIVAFRKTKNLLLNLSSFNLINYWALNSDNLIIGRLYSSYDLGIYNRAFRMLKLTTSLIAGLFSTVLYPSLKKYVSDGGNFRSEYDSILGVISLVNYPIIAVLILMPKIMVRILWGENWMMVADYLPFFGILIMFDTLMTTTGQIFILLEKERVLMKIGIVFGILRILTIIIGSLISVKGIVMAIVIANLGLFIPLKLYIMFYRTFGYSFRYLVNFWVPKIIIGILFFVLVILKLEMWLIISMVIYLVHIVYYQRNDLIKLKPMIKALLRKK